MQPIPLEPRRVIDFFTRRQYRSNDHYPATLEPGHAVTSTMAGLAGDLFMARIGAAVASGPSIELPSPTPVQGGGGCSYSRGKRFGNDFRRTTGLAIAADTGGLESMPQHLSYPTYRMHRCFE